MHAVLIYMQNGAGSKYNFQKNLFDTVEVTTSWQRFTFDARRVELTNADLSAAHLALYGTYGTGRVVSATHIQLEIGPSISPFVSDS